MATLGPRFSGTNDPEVGSYLEVGEYAFERNSLRARALSLGRLTFVRCVP
jgi:hypothetical protein